MHEESTASMDAAQTATSLVLEQLPDGEFAWLRPKVSSPLDRYRLTDRVVITEEGDDMRCVVTDAGRRALAEAACFGRCPTVAEVMGSRS